MNTPHFNSASNHMELAKRIMAVLERKGVREHPLAFDLCHSSLVMLSEEGLRADVQRELARVVERVIEAEVAHLDSRVLWGDLWCIQELQAVGAL